MYSVMCVISGLSFFLGVFVGLYLLTIGMRLFAKQGRAFLKDASGKWYPYNPKDAKE